MDTILNYEIHEKIAETVKFEVYRAVHKDSRKRVVIKILGLKQETSI